MKYFKLVVLLFCVVQTVSAKVQSVLDYAALWQDYRKSAATLQPAYNFPYQGCFDKAAKKYKVPMTLLLAIARGESDFNSSARSSANAIGVMQIVWPGTAKYLGIHSLKQLQKPCVNIDAGARYFRELLDRYHGDPHRALAAYNYGPGRIGVKGGAIPKGAIWYSGYIYDHLQYVLGAKGKAGGDYRQELKWPLLVFDQPYRAKAFVSYLQSRDKTLRLEWFDRGFGRFQVVALYRAKTKSALRARLQRLGFDPGTV